MPLLAGATLLAVDTETTGFDVGKGERVVESLRTGEFQARQHARERADKSGNRIGRDRDSQGREARSVAVGVDRQTRALRSDSRQRVHDERPPGEDDLRLVYAPKTAGLTAGKHQAEGGIGPRVRRVPPPSR